MDRKEIETIFEEFWLEMRQMEMEQDMRDDSDYPKDYEGAFYDIGFKEGTYSAIRHLANRLGIYYEH